MKSKIKKINTTAGFVLENLDAGNNLTDDEIKACMMDIIDIADKCIEALNSVEFDLLELLRKVRQ